MSYTSENNSDLDGSYLTSVIIKIQFVISRILIICNTKD